MQMSGNVILSFFVDGSPKPAILEYTPSNLVLLNFSNVQAGSTCHSSIGFVLRLVFAG